MRRLDFGWFVRPGSETGTGAPRVEPVLGYLVAHAAGLLLFDTGMGSRADVDAHYRPRPTGLEAALEVQGVRLEDITHVSNCHLHFDHCGGNPLVADRPTFVQRSELAAARAPDYTLPELVADSRYVELDGESEILPGVLLVPTPGHTDGHQSLVVRRRDGVVVVVAGQSHDTASAYGADVLARRARGAGHDEPLPVHPAWVDRLQELDPRVVYFAHDQAVWTP